MRCVSGSSLDEHERVRAVRVAAARCPSSVRADHEERRRLGEQRAVAFRELGFRVAREPVVRLVDAARERAVSERTPRQSEHEHADDSQRDPQADASATAPAIRARGVGCFGGRVVFWRRDLALLAATAIQPVGLGSLGHSGRYGSPRRGGSPRHRARRGRDEDPLGPRRSGGERRRRARGARAPGSRRRTSSMPSTLQSRRCSTIGPPRSGTGFPRTSSGGAGGSSTR